MPIRGYEPGQVSHPCCPHCRSPREQLWTVTKRPAAWDREEVVHVNGGDVEVEVGRRIKTDSR